MATAGNVAASQKTRYARLGHASQNLIPYILQQLLLHFEDPNAIYSKYLGNSYLKNRLSAEEKKKVKNASINGYVNFDIPLICSILRNVNGNIVPPTRGWNCNLDPGPNDTTIGDDLERCRRTRNYIIHRGNTDVTDQELEDYFKIFTGVAGRLETILGILPGEFVNEFETLKVCCMDENTENTYIDNLRVLAQKAKQAEEVYFEKIRQFEKRERENVERISELKNYLDQTESILEQREWESEHRISQLEGTIQSLTIPGFEHTKIITQPQDTTCIEGEDIKFDCEVLSSYSIPTWSKNGQEVRSDDQRKIESKNTTHTLAIPQVTKEDSGLYTMEIGDKRCEVYLNVEERKPSLIELREYQRELAKIALKGENTIILAGTNAGKTYVAFHIIENHLLKNPDGKVVFLTKTNVLLQQQHERACNIFSNLYFQGKIHRWDASAEEECEPFAKIVQRVRILFCTPQSLCNYLDEQAKMKVSLNDFSLIVLDECHHTIGKDPFNEIMSYYRRHKYGPQSNRIPQILGLTASPGTNRAIIQADAVEHLKKLMVKMDVSRLSTVRDHESELLEHTATPKKVLIQSKSRQNDPVQTMIIRAMEDIESLFNSQIVQSFLLQTSDETRLLIGALAKIPSEKTGEQYIKWMAQTKALIENVMLKDQVAPPLLHTFFRHLEFYADCLEINSLLEIDHVKTVVKNAYAEEANNSHDAIIEEKIVLDKLQEVYLRLVELENIVESNPDVIEIINTLKQEFQRPQDDSRSIIFVKRRVTAKALAERLPQYLKSLYLTGQRSKDRSGLLIKEQQEVMEKFRNGECLCLVATSVASEGVDIPQCNLMIRYKYRVDEISSYQMAGRIRRKEGKEVIISPGEDFENENQNILRQDYMKEAIKQVIDLDLTKHISIAEKDLYDAEENDRWLAKMTINRQEKESFSVNSKFCGCTITDSQFLRHIKSKYYIVYDKTIFKKINSVPLEKANNFDSVKQTAHVVELKHGHQWGSILVYQKCKFVALAKDHINLYDSSHKIIKFKKWSEIDIDELTDDEISTYLYDQSTD